MASPSQTPASFEPSEDIGQMNLEMNRAISPQNPTGYCGLIRCIWVPHCFTPGHFNQQSSQSGNLPISSGQPVLPEFHSPHLNSLLPTTPISSPSSSHPPITFDTFSPATESPIMESDNNTPFRPSPIPSPPSPSLPSSPYLSDTDMGYEDDIPPSIQSNPYTTDSHFFEPWKRVNAIVAKDEEDESIKKNEDVLIFLIEHPLPSSSSGKGSRGGVEKYSCAFPGCTEVCSRRDRGVDHVLIHFGAKPYRCGFCPLKFLRKADLARHYVRNGTCPGNGQENRRPKKGKASKGF